MCVRFKAVYVKHYNNTQPNLIMHYMHYIYLTLSLPLPCIHICACHLYPYYLEDKTYRFKHSLIGHVDGRAEQVFQSPFLAKGVSGRHQILLLPYNYKRKQTASYIRAFTNQHITCQYKTVLLLKLLTTYADSTK